MNLEIVALVMMIVVALILFYSIIAIHDIPYLIAKKRNHPHIEAIHYAGWVSMFTLHAIWPFLWIWATLYHAERGYGFNNIKTGGNAAEFEARISALEQKIEALTNKPTLEKGE